jgi:hypothetical protein
MSYTLQRACIHPLERRKLGKWVGVAEKQGDALTYLILTANTDRVIARSVIHSATNTKNPSLRAPQSSAGGELENKPKPILQSTENLLGIDPSKLKLPKSSPDDLLGITFLDTLTTARRSEQNMSVRSWTEILRITTISSSYVCYETTTTMRSLLTRSCPTSLKNNTQPKEKVPRSHGHSSLCHITKVQWQVSTRSTKDLHSMSWSSGKMVLKLMNL